MKKLYTPPESSVLPVLVLCAYLPFDFMVNKIDPSMIYPFFLVLGFGSYFGP